MSRLRSLLPKTGCTFALALLTSSSMATEFEITPYIGLMSGSDLTIPETNTSISLDNATHFGIGVAWQESPNGQGQVLINYVSHDYEYGEEGSESSVDIIYAHFNGIAQFRQKSYVTTVSFGLGAARFSADGGSEIAPSFTAAIGTRYELSDAASIVTEIRGYASLMRDGDSLFCQNDLCDIEYDEAVWINTSISIGFSYKF